MTEMLRLLEKDARYTPAELATMLGKREEAVREDIAACENDNIILGYGAVIDWERTTEDQVTALIQVKIAPQRNDGYDRIAERIYQFDEVECVYLMSGSYDLAVILTEKSLKEISRFVYAKLAPIEGVTSTATHFIMKKYKDKNRIFSPVVEQEERPLYI
ncbi:MAG: Lrp/AsnC family transcriptional regulator [Ruminococcaceae bacterium]|nr:Lrp/AsnC family transcriptional regulator [Oscillospiraceae bacterium]